MRTEKEGLRSLFLGVEGAVYVCFLILDLAGRPSSEVKYVGICLCFFMALTLSTGERRLIPAALGLTVAADTFLVLLDDHYLAGVLAFCGVQALYAAWLSRRGGRGWLAARAVVLALALGALGLLGVLDGLTAASAFSFSQLTVSALHSTVLARRKKVSYLLPAALGLFWCCDACVGLRNVLTYLPDFPLPALAAGASFCIWMFYLPSQVLLVLWGAEEGEKT